MPSPPPAEAHQSLLIRTNAHPPHQRPLSARLHIWWAGISLPRRAHPLGCRPNPSPPNLKPPTLGRRKTPRGISTSGHKAHIATVQPRSGPRGGRRTLTLARRQAGSIRLHIWWARTCRHPPHAPQAAKTNPSPPNLQPNDWNDSAQSSSGRGRGEARQGRAGTGA